MSDYKRNPRSARRARKSLSRKALVVLSLMMVLVLAAVGGTIAWLTAESGAVTNTFTVGDINIDLKEHKLNSDNTLDDTQEVTANNNYKVVPGRTSPKDPFVTVAANSEKCYVYVTVENNLVIGDKTVASVNIVDTDWVVVDTSKNKTLYRYIGTQSTGSVVDAMNAAVTLPVFTQVTFSESDITKANISQLNNKTIVVNAYAHQSENTTEAAADAAAIAWAFPPVAP